MFRVLTPARSKSLAVAGLAAGSVTELLMHQVLGQLALLLHFVEHPDQAEVGGQHAADAEVAGALHVLDGVNQLVGAAMLQTDDLAGG